MEFINKINFKDFQSLHLKVGWKILDNKIIKKSLNNSLFKVSAIEDNKVVGIARIVGDNYSHGLLTDVIVHPDFQSKGIGKAMINYLLNNLQKYVNKYCDEFLLELLPTNGYIEFYKKCGFKHIPENMEGCYLWIKNQNIYAKGSKKYVMHLNKEPFESIKSGKKTIEMRLNDEKRKILKKNDILLFINKNNDYEMIKAKIKNLHKYNNFYDLYKNFDKTKLGYKKNENANPNDMEKYYSKEDINKYGVVGIEIEIIKN